MKVPSAGRVVLFTKPAIPGRVKTRLSPGLSPEQASEIHRALVIDTTTELSRGAFDLVIAWDLIAGEELDSSLMAGVADSQIGRIRHVEQQGRDLGERLYAGLAGALQNSPEEPGLTIVAVGSDHPEIDHREVEKALAAIEAGAADVVIGPASDGGYYLIAVRGSALSPRMFDDIEWSSSSVATATVARCAELGLAVKRLETAHDLDTEEDLRALIARVNSGDAVLHPALARLLGVWRMV